MALVVLTMSPVFLLFLTASSRDRARAAEMAQENMLVDAEATARKLEAVVFEGHRALATLARVPSVRGEPDVACMLLDDASRIDERYVSMALVDPAGRYVCQTIDADVAGVSVADRRWVRTPLDRGVEATEVIRLGRVSGAPVLVLSQPVTDDGGTVRAVLAAGINLQDLLEAEHEPHISPVLALVAPDGLLAVHGEAELTAPIFDLPGFFEGDDSARELREEDGDDPKLGAIVRVAGVDGLAVTAVASEADLLGPLTADFRRNMGWLLLVTTLSLLGAWLGARHFIARPLDRIAEAAQALAGGDLGARASLVGGSRELRELGSTFDRMADALDARDREARRARAELDETHQRLAHAQKMEAVGQLTGGVAHDFNNLLTVVKGCLGLVDTRRLNEEDHGLIDDAIQASERGVELTARLLAFSRRQALSPRRIDLNELAVSMRPILARTLGEHVKIVYELTEPGPSAVADPHQVESTLVNLAVNARDAMPNGGRLTIRTDWLEAEEHATPDLAPGRYAALSVSDEGTGMAPDVMARAIEPFFTTKARGRGTGLGLSGAYGFARQSGGTLVIDSTEGMGTNVHLFLPATAHGQDDARPDTDHPVGASQPAAS